MQLVSSGLEGVYRVQSIQSNPVQSDVIWSLSADRAPCIVASEGMIRVLVVFGILVFAMVFFGVLGLYRPQHPRLACGWRRRTQEPERGRQLGPGPYSRETLDASPEILQSTPEPGPQTRTARARVAAGHA